MQLICYKLNIDLVLQTSISCFVIWRNSEKKSKNWAHHLIIVLCCQVSPVAPNAFSDDDSQLFGACPACTTLLLILYLACYNFATFLLG